MFLSTKRRKDGHCEVNNVFMVATTKEKDGAYPIPGGGRTGPYGGGREKGSIK